MKEFNYIELPQDLECSILTKIEKIRRDEAVLRFGIQGSISVLSLLGIIKIGMFLWQSFIQTGFYSYLSLIFSDSSAIAIYWKEFVFSLVESLPILGVISLLIILTIFIWSSSKAIKDAKIMLIQRTV